MPCDLQSLSNNTLTRSSCRNMPFLPRLESLWTSRSSVGGPGHEPFPEDAKQRDGSGSEDNFPWTTWRSVRASVRRAGCLTAAGGRTVEVKTRGAVVDLFISDTRFPIVSTLGKKPFRSSLAQYNEYRVPGSHLVAQGSDRKEVASRHGDGRRYQSMCVRNPGTVRST